ncbi:DUF3883 domain-containing protein [Candidatus Falkowbacteria bacterium]|nr:DUF3883 domain-containing protein [Candidatus Falkowbacteria bacterium]
MEHISKKTPQNISDTLKEIGELSCVFYLYYHFNNKGWSVYRNYDEKGYDILLFNEKTGKKRKIEVKTRQKLISSLSNRNKNTHFTLTEVEKNEADFLIGFWFEYNMFFIVPTSELMETKSNDKKLYKFIVSLNKNNDLNESSKEYLGSWESIIK